MPSPADAPPPEAVRSLQLQLEDHLYRTRGQPLRSASPYDVYAALCYTVRDRLVEGYRTTAEAFYRDKPKFVAFLSAEYLPGKQLSKNLLYTGLTETAAAAVEDFGLSLDVLLDFDAEPGLGNGGLGRLSSCFLDSAASLGLPCVGYGIRYEFGIFRQTFRDGWQVESPDDWLHHGNPWEFAQPDEMVQVGFGGRTESFRDRGGRYGVNWIPAETVLGEPNHMLVAGYGSGVVSPLRLWRARAGREFDFQPFDMGDYVRAVEQKTRSENISKVLYPNDSTPQGRELRLRQQYFFVACSLSDVIRLFLLRETDWDRFPEQVAVHLNDTHPALAIPELMRLLVDVHGLGWDGAWSLVTRSVASTQHTLLPESLESWPVSLFARLLPRHLEIIYEINARFVDQVKAKYPGDDARLARLSIIEEGPEKRIRMANLACVGSHSVNGVAELQSRLLSRRVMADFHHYWPQKFNNKTNGVTPRRFLRLANPRLAALISSRIGEGWVRDLDELARLEPLADDAGFRRAWREVKRKNKQELAAWLGGRLPVEVEPDSLFDVMVKRLHEYKRQVLKTLHIVTLCHRIRERGTAGVVPRTFLFGAKAAPGYGMAKLIIKLINSVAEVVNNDSEAGRVLRVVFVPNFNVTAGEKMYPAADLSEQISMAGKEASGTSNMKLALNGALTVGTLDGANVEIRERVGEDNFFVFGLTADEAVELEQRGYRPRDFYESDPELRAALDAIASGAFSPSDPGLFRPLFDSLVSGDEYLTLADYRAYIDAQERVETAFRDPEAWSRKSILNTARCGFFSSDRAIRQYAEQIWKASAFKLEPEAGAARTQAVPGVFRSSMRALERALPPGELLRGEVAAANAERDRAGRRHGAENQPEGELDDFVRDAHPAQRDGADE